MNETCSGQDKMTGVFERGNEFSVAIKGRKLLEHLITCQG
jgi:hypothetical protein